MLFGRMMLVFDVEPHLSLYIWNRSDYLMLSVLLISDGGAWDLGTFDRKYRGSLDIY